MMAAEQKSTLDNRLQDPTGKLAHDADLAVTIYFRKPHSAELAANGGYISAYTKYPWRDGETWHRGNDLPDGNYTEETLERIIARIREGFAES